MARLDIYSDMRNISSPSILPLFVLFTWTCLTAQSSLHEQRLHEPGVEKVQRILQQLRHNYKNGSTAARTYQLTQQEINASLLAQLRQRDQTAVESISILLTDGSFTTLVEIDMDRLELEEDSSTTGILRLLLQGKQTLEIKGQLQVENGIGRYRVQQIRLNGVSLPALLANELLSSLARREDLPFDPTASFQLPYGIKSIRFRPGRLTIAT